MKVLFRIILLLATITLIPYHSVVCNEQVLEPVMVIEKVTELADKTVVSIPKIVLITIDGVRWQEVFNGTDPSLYRGKKLSARELLPNLYSNFIDHGMVLGKESSFVASGPAHISLPGYLEIMRGHPSTDCIDNDCNPKLDKTMVDLFETAAVFTSWDTIRKATTKNPDNFVINCGRNYRSLGWKNAKLEDNTTFPEAWDPIYRPDEWTKKAALEYLQYNNPQFAWIGLGDTDEWAHAGVYDKYLESLVEADQFVGQLIQLVNSGPDAKNFTFIVTADHGRSSDWRSHGWDAESAKDWLMMSGRGVPAKGFAKYKGKKSLSNILPTVKKLVGEENVKGSLL